MVILFESYIVLVCLDNKHRVKVGEPGYPLAAAERGRRVLVCADTMIEVEDHDFLNLVSSLLCHYWLIFQLSCLEHGTMVWSQIYKRGYV